MQSDTVLVATLDHIVIVEPAQLSDILQKPATEGEGQDAQVPSEETASPRRGGYTFRCHFKSKA